MTASSAKVQLNPQSNVANPQCVLIGMLHVPINTLVAAPPAWREFLGMPHPQVGDWQLIHKLGCASPSTWEGKIQCNKPPPIGNDPTGAFEEAAELVSRLSFFGYLEDRVLAEAEILHGYSFQGMVAENVGAPYFMRNSVPVVIPAVMRRLSKALRSNFPDALLGLQILACAGDLALGIAVENGLDFVRAEGLLFEGTRPEGQTQNVGCLATAYMARDSLLARNQATTAPLIFADLVKKHTFFPHGMDNLDLWLDNIVFQKLEGVILTGAATGQPVDETDLVAARQAVDAASDLVMELSGQTWCPPVLVGSGVGPTNVAMCRRHTNAAIVGSSLKQCGYWEAPIDKQKTEEFIHAWSR
jgi:uncharacterized protein